MRLVLLCILICLGMPTLSVAQQQKQYEQVAKEVKPNMEVRRFIRNASDDLANGNKELAVYRIQLLTDAYFDGKVATNVKVTSAHIRSNIKETFQMCFFSQAYYFRLMKQLKETGLADKALLKKAQQIAEDVLVIPQLAERGPNNRPFHFALGNIYAAQLFPHSPKVKRWKDYATAVWNDWYLAGDTYEPGYVAHNIMQVVELGLQLGKEKELKSDKIRRTFYRYRDQIGPSGLTFAPGDGSGQSDYVGGLIAAAKVTKDPTLFWAADLAFWAGDYSVKGGKRRDRNSETDQQEYRSLFHELLAEGIQLQMPEVSCEVQKMFPATYQVTDRLLLAPSRLPGKPFVGYYLNDCAETTHHAHEDNRGEVYHYEVDGVMYLSRSGWSKWVGHANTFVVEDASNEFPFYNTQGMREGYWYKASTNMRIMRNFQESDHYRFIKSNVPVHDYLFESTRKNEPGFFYVNPDALAGECDQLQIQDLTFRFHTYPRSENGNYSFDNGMMWYREYRDIAPSDEAKTILIDNVAVTGPKGKRVLFDFETLPENVEVKIYPLGSKGDASKVLTVGGEDVRKYLSLVDGKDGKALQIRCELGRTDVIFKGLHVDTDLSHDYNRMDADYCYKSDVSEYLRPSFKIAVNGQAPRSMYVDRQQGGILQDVVTNQQGEDCYGAFTYDGVFTYDSKWTRKSLLTMEGYLIVMDEYWPGASADGMVGGPVWQLMTPPETGYHWFDAKAGNCEGNKLMVYFHPDTHNRYGVQKQHKFQKDQNYAVYAQSYLQAGKPARFLTVMIPHDAALDGVTVSGKSNYNGMKVSSKDPRTGISTSIDEIGNSQAVIVLEKGEKIKITLSANGEWNIRR